MSDNTATYDVVVVGSGAAALTAALAASLNGLSVCILEKTAEIGGTSSVSGGSIWAPVNPWAFADGGDSREDALRYLQRLALGRSPDALLEAFVDGVNPMLQFLRSTTGIDFVSNERHSDYQPDLPGARPGGRTIQNGLYETQRLKEFASALRRPGSHAVPLTKLERDAWGEDTPERWDWELIESRRRDGVVGQGMALVGELLEGCLSHGAELRTDSPVTGLIRSNDRIAGCVVANARENVLAAKAVVLASGGFEWNSDLVTRFLSRPMDGPASPPANTGDGLILAMEAGAALAHLDEAWWAPVLHAGDDYDGAPHFRTTSGLRSLPGGILVNSEGRRFANETMNYNDLGKAMGMFDSANYRFGNVPTWFVFDSTFRSKYSVGPARPEDPTPDWMVHAGSLTDLAASVGIAPEGLNAEVEAFNRDAAAGKDTRFHRGESSYDQYRGDISAAHRNLAPITGPEFFAVPIHLGCIGTKGGPVTDADGRVLNPRGDAIVGLYACGNAAACVFGPGYPGGGATLAAGMTFAYRAARAIAAGG